MTPYCGCPSLQEILIQSPTSNVSSSLNGVLLLLVLTVESFSVEEALSCVTKLSELEVEVKRSSLFCLMRSRSRSIGLVTGEEFDPSPSTLAFPPARAPAANESARAAEPRS